MQRIISLFALAFAVTACGMPPTLAAARSTKAAPALHLDAAPLHVDATTLHLDAALALPDASASGDGAAETGAGAFDIVLGDDAASSAAVHLDLGDRGVFDGDTAAVSSSDDGLIVSISGFSCAGLRTLNLVVPNDSFAAGDTVSLQSCAPRATFTDSDGATLAFFDGALTLTAATCGEIAGTVSIVGAPVVLDDGTALSPAAP